MHENSGNSVIFYAHYTTDGVSTTSLTVTIDIYEVTRAGTATLVVDDGACTDVGAGIYRYLLASGTVDAAAEYIGVFHTATDTVDAQDIPAMWVIDRAGTEKLDNGITLADDAITASKFDESTAYPLKSADTGSTQVARVGADSDTLETLSDEIAAVKAETALIVADTGTDGVKINATQGAITWGQQKIIANVANEGALDIRNSNSYGIGQQNSGGTTGLLNFSEDGVGQLNEGGTNSVFNYGQQKIVANVAGEGALDIVNSNVGGAGQHNKGGSSSVGLWNEAAVGTLNDGESIGLVNSGSQDVSGFDPALALEATLTDIKGLGWTTETLKVIKDAVTNVDGNVADVFDDVGDVKAVVDTILADTNEIQADLADGGRTDLLIDAIKAKTDLIPASPAEAGEYTTAIAALQTDLDNPDQYKADVSALATTAHVQEVEDKVDIVDGIADAILDDTGTSGVLLSTSALGSIFDDEVIVGTYTFSDLLKIMAAALAGKLSGGGSTTLKFEGVDGASDVIVTTVDANKNRTNVVITV